ncbi:unnamed protein product, partial [marine sediment metagenome]
MLNVIMKKWVILAIGLAVVVIVVGIVLLFGCVQKQNEEPAVVINGEEKEVAVVNGVGITKNEFVQRLISLNGKPVLEQMIDEILIEQRAEEQKVKVKPKEIDVKIDEIKERFPSEEAFLQQIVRSGMTIEKLRQQFESQILMEKLILKEAIVTEEEIMDYFERNKDRFDKSEQIRVSHILVSIEKEA